MMKSVVSNEKIGLVAGFVGVLIFAAIGSWWLMQPSWQPILNSEGSPQSRLEIRNHLMKWAIPFKEEESTGNLLVKSSDLLVIRTKLAQLGIPEEPSPGLELFDQAEYGMSEFTQRVNYRRAIEAEISQTIRSFADVTSARVHLTIPKKSVFQDKAVSPKASVTVKSKPGQQLTRNQILGITELVAASVEELKPENVIVLNDKGEVVSVQGEDATTVQHTKYDLESYYATKALELVQGIAQTDDIKVSVNIVYNTDKITAVKEQLVPNADGEIGHLRRLNRQTTETAGEDGKDTSTNATIDEEYVFSTERSEIEYAPGEIERLGVGIVVMKDLTESMIADILNVVNSGLGIDPKRGDTVAVVAVPPANQPSIVNQNTLNDSASDVLPSGTSLLGASSSFDQLPVNSQKYLIFSIVIGFLVIGSIVMGALIRMKRKASQDVILLSTEDQEQLLLELRTWLARSPSGVDNA